MGNLQYIQDAIDGFESLYGEELTEQQRQNLVEALEFGEISLGVDAEIATEALRKWGEHTGDMERALDNAKDLKTFLLNFDGGTDDIDEYLADKYLEKLGITDEALGSFAALFTDFEKYQRHLEYEGWLFVPASNDTTIYVFSA